MKENMLVTVWEKARIQAFLLMGITQGRVEGGEGILLKERTKISSDILTFRAPVPSGVFKKFRMNSQDITESKPDTWDSRVSPNFPQHCKSVPS